jgi:hypothetical protein
MSASWYQPLLANDAAKGPRFDTDNEVQGTAIVGGLMYQEPAVKMTVGAAALAAAVAGVATGAAALSI